MAIEDLVDLTNPENHCNQDHDHSALPWPLPSCPWEDALDWAMGDHGFNEGAEEAGRIAVQYGLGLPEGVAGLIGQGLGNVWDRCNMMHFAVDVAKSGNVEPATAIAVLSQWHNCQALRCLAFHAGEIGDWLAQQ